MSPLRSFLASAGLIAGGPTFFSNLLGESLKAEAIFVRSLALTVGSIFSILADLLGQTTTTY